MFIHRADFKRSLSSPRHLYHDPAQTVCLSVSQTVWLPVCLPDHLTVSNCPQCPSDTSNEGLLICSDSNPNCLSVWSFVFVSLTVSVCLCFCRTWSSLTRSRSGLMVTFASSTVVRTFHTIDTDMTQNDTWPSCWKSCYHTAHQSLLVTAANCPFVFSWR